MLKTSGGFDSDLVIDYMGCLDAQVQSTCKNLVHVDQKKQTRPYMTRLVLGGCQKQVQTPLVVGAVLRVHSHGSQIVK